MVGVRVDGGGEDGMLVRVGCADDTKYNLPNGCLDAKCLDTQ